MRWLGLAGWVCLAIGGISAVLAAYDAWKIATIVVDQWHGPAAGTDFLNLYAGARLLLADPAQTYSMAAQLAVQRGLTGWDSPIVPFYLPPYAAVLISWLGWLGYPLAYAAWLVIGLVCLTLAIWWLAPRWTHGHVLTWVAISLTFLPCLLGLAQGQTAALMLLSSAAITAAMLGRTGIAARYAWVLIALGLLGLAIKPQLAILFVCALILAWRWAALALALALIGTLGALGLVWLGPEGIAAYSAISSQKLLETFTADPTFLIGPTLLHASHWYLGVTQLSNGLGGAMALAVAAVALAMWRAGARSDDRLLLQLAVLPIASVIVAPYALVYELTSWLVSFWLVWRYTEQRRAARMGLLWLAAAIWAAGDLGVSLPLSGGADIAAVLGIGAVAYVAWLYWAEPGHESKIGDHHLCVRLPLAS